ncbi:AI-2E family transporter [Candidatus Saccharibacteria bacterium]|nr:AI-2E family transporter [Candidatus Saccharibacteria bacterium]
MNSDRQITVNITNRTIIRTILLVAGAILFFHFIDEISRPLTLIFVSFFLALALNPVVSWMSRRLKIKSRARATAVAFLTVIMFLAGFFVLVIPPLVQQTRDFIIEVPSIVENFQEQDTSLSRAVERYNLNDRLASSANDFASEYSNFGGALLDTGKRVAGVVISVLAVLVMTFMMLVEGPRWIKLWWATMPDKRREHHQKLAYKMYKSVSGFVNGQVLLAALAGTMAFIALTVSSAVLDVSINAAALAGIVAVFALIPLFGNLISTALVVLVCLLNSFTLGIVVLVFFIIYQQIENLSIQPYIQSRISELTPLMVFISALIGISFGGILGAIVAIPAASTVKILLEDQLERRGIKAKIAETK